MIMLYTRIDIETVPQYYWRDAVLCSNFGAGHGEWSNRVATRQLEGAEVFIKIEQETASLF